MKFDYSIRTDTDRLSPAVAAIMDAARDRYRDNRLSVQFLKDDGSIDEWSFTTVESRDAFCAKLGKPFVVSGK